MENIVIHLNNLKIIKKIILKYLRLEITDHRYDIYDYITRELQNDSEILLSLMEHYYRFFIDAQ
jgi:hypothetical protein